jgi:hypothetical protein
MQYLLVAALCVLTFLIGFALGFITVITGILP